MNFNVAAVKLLVVALFHPSMVLASLSEISALGVDATVSCDAGAAPGGDEYLSCTASGQLGTVGTLRTSLTLGGCEGVTTSLTGSPSASIGIDISSADIEAATASEDGSKTIVVPSCFRADVLANNNSGTPESVAARKWVVTTSFTYATTGDFSANVSTAEFTASDANASATRAGSVEAYRCDANGSDASGADAVSIGSTLNICVYSPDTDVSVAVTDLQLKNGETVLVAPVTGSNANFVTSIETISVEGLSTSVQKVSTLMVPAIYDQAGGSTISATGTAAITYNRRMLRNAVRDLQSADETAPFEIEFDLEAKEVPAIAMEGSEESGAFMTGVGMAAAIAGGALALL